MAAESSIGLGNFQPTTQLSYFIANWHPDEVSAVALREAKRVLLDVIGVTLAGAAEPASQVIAQVIRETLNSNGPAAVVGHGFRASTADAALANGTTAHALDFDDFGKIPYAGHPTVCIAPAALAVAESVNATGQAFLESILIGFEIVTRLGRSAGGASGHAYRVGFHGTSLFGVFGATAAAARLLRLTAEQVQNALGIAASGPKGLRANYGTDTKPLHAGEANRAGVLAALLAQAGFSANKESLEAPLGWADAVSSNSQGNPTLTEGLGGVLAIEQGPTNFKRFPSCQATDASIKGVLSLFARHSLHADQIDRIEISIAPSIMRETLVYDWPATGLQGKFCLAYCVAAAWVDGKVSVGTFSNAKLASLGDYRDRISIIDSESSAVTKVAICMTDGRVFEQAGATGLPGPQDPAVPPPNYELDDRELQQKFIENVCEIRSRKTADAILEAVEQLEEAASLQALTELLL